MASNSSEILEMFGHVDLFVPEIRLQSVFLTLGIAACMLPLALHPFSKTFTEIFAAIIDRKPEKTTCPAIL